MTNENHSVHDAYTFGVVALLVLGVCFMALVHRPKAEASQTQEHCANMRVTRANQDQERHHEQSKNRTD